MQVAWCAEWWVREAGCDPLIADLNRLDGLLQRCKMRAGGGTVRDRGEVFFAWQVSYSLLPSVMK